MRLGAGIVTCPLCLRSDSQSNDVTIGNTNECARLQIRIEYRISTTSIRSISIAITITHQKKKKHQSTRQNTQQAEASMQNWQNLMNWSLHRDMWCSMDEWYEFMPQFKERVFGGDVSKWLPKATNSMPLVCMYVYGFVCSDLRTRTLQKHAHTFRPCLCTVRG
jgi:hypothetical protein